MITTSLPMGITKLVVGSVILGMTIMSTMLDVNWLTFVALIFATIAMCWGSEEIMKNIREKLDETIKSSVENGFKAGKQFGIDLTIRELEEKIFPRYFPGRTFKDIVEATRKQNL